MRTFPLILALGLLVVLAAARTSSAQSLEIGASIATSCQGSDGSFCDESQSGLRTAGPYASIWFKDRIEVAGRVVWLNQPDQSGMFFLLSESIELSVTDRRRTIVQAEAIWHFRRGKRARPLFGIGYGRYWDERTVACQPPRCEASLTRSGLDTGNVRDPHFDASVVVGMSVLVSPRVRLRGGWRYHNPFHDEFAMSELFLAAGFRLRGD